MKTNGAAKIAAASSASLNSNMKASVSCVARSLTLPPAAVCVKYRSMYVFISSMYQNVRAKQPSTAYRE